MKFESEFDSENLANLLDRFDIPTAEEKKENAQSVQKEKTSGEDSNCAEVGLCADPESSSFTVEAPTEDAPTNSTVTTDNSTESESSSAVLSGTNIVEDMVNQVTDSSQDSDSNMSNTENEASDSGNTDSLPEQQLPPADYEPSQELVSTLNQVIEATVEIPKEGNSVNATNDVFYGEETAQMLANFDFE